jgi:hypothetical protein
MSPDKQDLPCRVLFEDILDCEFNETILIFYSQGYDDSEYYRVQSMKNENCLDCDGSGVGSVSCAPDGYAVCRACEKLGCLITIEEYNNPNEYCKQKREEAIQAIIEFEKEMFGEQLGRRD